LRKLVDLVRAYYAACDSGDVDRIAACFTEDASHYYQRMRPQHGGRAIAEHFGAQARDIEGRWVVENGIEQGEQAVVEWTMTWRDPRSGEPRLDRGTDWFLFRGERIAEVRCYHHSSERNRSGDLVGFDHAGRGHTMPRT
jgi:ketosteroid isomerase-like protein